jgi:hypothetical protein
MHSVIRFGVYFVRCTSQAKFISDIYICIFLVYNKYSRKIILRLLLFSCDGVCMSGNYTKDHKP